MSDRIKVGIKVRPLISREKNGDIHWVISNDGLQQQDPVSFKPKGDLYSFDHLFGPDSTNREVFEVLVKPIVQSAVHGFNGTIFAYGQTSSGKTYTMMGDKYETGVIPLAVDCMFKEMENRSGREYLLRVAYIEIYNEKINDLLKRQLGTLKIAEDNFGNVIVKDLTEEIVNSPQMCLDLMKKGEHNRKIGETNMNDRSSRSHTIFRIIIESREAGSGADDVVQVSHLNLVDLAGSERADSTGAVGERLKEGCAINKSLFMLSHVISKLSDGEQFVNFRDSKLTRILQSSLGGNANTSIICSVTPASGEETLSTLGFASRARKIKNAAQVNEVVSDAALLKRYARQINKLKSELDEAKRSQNLFCVEEMASKLQEEEEKNRLLQERISMLREKMIISSGSNSTELDEQRMKSLRRRTWTAPSQMKKRLSCGPASNPSRFLPFPGEHSLANISVVSSKSSECDFGSPLEDFEADLLKRRPSPIAFEDDGDEEPLPLDTRFISTRRGGSSGRMDESYFIEQIEKLKAENTRLSSDLAEAQTKASSLAKIVRDQALHPEEIERLRTENERYALQINKAQEDLRDHSHLADEIERLKVENEKYVLQLNKLEDSQRNQDQLAGEIERLKAENEKYILQLHEHADGSRDQGQLAEEIEMLKAENEKYLLQLNEQVDSLRDQRQLAEEIERLKAENEKYVLQLNEQVGSLRDQRQLAEEIERLKAENEKYVLQLNEQVGSLRDQRQLTEEIERLKAENEKYILQLHEHADGSRDQGELAEEIERLKAENEKYVLQLNEQVGSLREGQLAEEIGRLKAENEEYLLQLNKQEDGLRDHGELAEEIKRLKAENEKYVLQLNEPVGSLREGQLAEEIERLKAENEKYVVQMSSEQEVARMELSSLRQTVVSLEDELELFKGSKPVETPMRLRRELTVTELELTELKNFTRLEKQLHNEEQRSAVERLQRELDDRLKIESTLKTDLDLLRSELKKVQKELETVRQENQNEFDLKILLMDTKKSLAERTDTNKELESELEEAKERLRNSDLLQIELESLRKTLEEVKHQYSESENSLKSQLARIKELEDERCDFDLKMDAAKQHFSRRELELTMSLEEAWCKLKSLENGGAAVTCGDRALHVEDIGKLRAENEEYAEEVGKLKESVSLLERELSIFRGSDAARRGRLSALYVLEEEPSIGELSDEVDGLRTENRRFRLLISDLEEAKEALEKSLAAKTKTHRQEIARLSHELAESRKKTRSRSLSECDVTLKEAGSEVAHLLEEVDELKRLNDTRTEENLELRAALEKMSKECETTEETARVLNTSFVEESNSADEFVSCTEDTLTIPSKSCSVLSLEMGDKLTQDDIGAVIEGLRAEKMSLEEEVSRLKKALSNSEKVDEKEACKRKHEAMKVSKDDLMTDTEALEDVSFSSLCDVTLIETASPNLKAKRRRLSTKFEATPKCQPNSPIREVSGFDELKEANSCLKAELDSKNDTIAMLSEEISQVRHELSKLLEEKELLQQTVEDKEDADVKTRVAASQSVEEQNRLVEERVCTLKEEKRRLQEQLEERIEEVARLENELSTIKEQVSTDHKESEKATLLQEEVLILQHKISFLTSASVENERLEKEVEEKIEEISRLEKELSKFDLEVTSLKKRVAFLENDGDTKNDILEEELVLSEEMLRSEKNVIGRLERDVQSNQEEILTQKDSCLETQLEEKIKKSGCVEKKLFDATDSTKLRDHSANPVLQQLLLKESEVESLKIQVCKLSLIEDVNKSLKEDLNEKERKLYVLESTLEETLAASSLLSEEKGCLESRLAEKEKRISDFECEVKALEEKVSVLSLLSEDKKCLESCVSEKEKKISQLESSINALEEKIAAVEEEKRSLASELDNTQKNLEEEAKKLALVEAELKAASSIVSEEKGCLENRLAEKEKKISDFECKVKTLEEKVTALNSLSEEYEVLEISLSEKEKKISQLESSINALEEKIAAVEEEKRSLASELDNTQKNLKEKTKRLALVEAELKAASSIVSEEKGCLESRLAEKEKRISDFECELKALEEKVSVLNLLSEDKKYLESCVFEKEKKISQLESSINALEEKIAAVEEEKRSLASELDNTQKNLAEKTERLALVEAELEIASTISEEKNTVQSCLAGKQKMIFDLESKVKALEESLACSEEKELLESCLSEKEERILELKSGVNVLEEKVAAVEEEKRSLMKELDNARRHLEEKSEKIALTEVQLKAASSIHLEEKASLQSRLAEKEKKISNFECEVKALEEKVAVLNTLSEEKECLESCLSERDKRILILESGVSALEGKIAAVAEEKQSLLNDLDNALKDLEEKTETIALMEHQLKVSVADAVKLKEDFAQFTHELSSTKNLLVSFEETNKSLKSELNESIKKISELDDELREKLALLNAANEDKVKITKELEAKCIEVKDQECMVKYLEDRAQSKRDNFEKEKAALKKELSVHIYRYRDESNAFKSQVDALQSEIETIRSSIVGEIKAANPDQDVSETTNCRDLVGLLVSSVKKDNPKRYDFLKEKYRSRLMEYVTKLKSYEARDQEAQGRIHELESNLKKYEEEVRRIGNLEKTLTAMSDREKKWQPSLKRLQVLSGLADGAVDACMARIEEELLMARSRGSQLPTASVTTEDENWKKTRDELVDKEKVKTTLAEQVPELGGECWRCTAKIRRLESLLSEAREKVADREKLESQKKGLLNRLTAKDTEIEELQQRLRDEQSTARLKSPRRVSYSQSEELSKELKLKTQQLEFLSASLEEQRRLYTESVSKAVVAAERKETARLKEECKHLKDQLSTLSKTLETLQNEKRSLAAQLAERPESNTLTTRADSSVSSEVDALKEQVRRMAEELVKKDEEILEHKSKAEEFDKECDIVADELKRTRARENDLLDKVEEDERNAKKFKETEEQLSQLLATKETELAALRSQLDELKSKTKPSPLVPQGQIARPLDWFLATNTGPKGSLSSLLLSSKSEESQNGCQCAALRQQLQSLRAELSDAMGLKVELELELGRQNYPFKKKIQVLEKEIDYLKKANSELRADNRRLQNSCADATMQGCEVCRMRLHAQKDVHVQTTEMAPVRDLNMGGRISGIVEAGNILILEEKIRRLEKENNMLKTLCKERLRVMRDYEKQLQLEAKSDESK